MNFVAWGRATLATEAEALGATAARLGPSFADACEAILKRRGKVITTGLGKSGHIARKIASTLSSTGTSAFFLHPTEALHGDFGMIQPDDSLIAIAYGGETQEVLEVARFARRLHVPVIGITGKLESSLATISDYALDGSVVKEADPHNLAPTSSSTVAIALGDAIACALAQAKGFSSGDFAALHPGGSLGRRLSRVADHMHTGVRLPRVREDADFHQTLEAVTAHNFGIVAVVSPEDVLIGAVSDGDVRRALLKLDGAALKCRARDVMTKAPKTVTSDALALDALTLMNEKQITQLFVTCKDGKLAGIVRLHDLLAAKIV